MTMAGRGKRNSNWRAEKVMVLAADTRPLCAAGGSLEMTKKFFWPPGHQGRQSKAC